MAESRGQSNDQGLPRCRKAARPRTAPHLGSRRGHSGPERSSDALLLAGDHAERNAIDSHYDLWAWVKPGVKLREILTYFDNRCLSGLIYKSFGFTSLEVCHDTGFTAPALLIQAVHRSWPKGRFPDTCCRSSGSSLLVSFVIKRKTSAS